MDDKDFGAKLKSIRTRSGKTVPEISSFLISLGYKASEKTIYSWEAGRSQPTPDAFLDLCKFCGITDVLSTFGYKKSPGTTEVVPGEDNISLEESNYLLRALGLIQEGQQLSDDDLAFLAHIIGLLEAWFSKHK
ncbi:helix-turn-helix transcriptional regulator [Anaerotruncus colihominis]|uniref:helix-turn-helix domain-containing protein n=1 Tax=Anaerotruncus colihominis TaxID=169435 RepID=UPI001DFCB6BF|nr:helix-turn-helix domain-containing protein [Clostridiales bacterium]